MSRESKFESATKVIRDFEEHSGWSDQEFERRLKAGDPAAAIVFAASRIIEAIDNAQAEIVEHCGPK
jgi:hypothetical protein